VKILCLDFLGENRPKAHFRDQCQTWFSGSVKNAAVASRAGKYRAEDVQRTCERKRRHQGRRLDFPMSHASFTEVWTTVSFMQPMNQWLQSRIALSLRPSPQHFVFFCSCCPALCTALLESPVWLLTYAAPCYITVIALLQQHPRLPVCRRRTCVAARQRLAGTADEFASRWWRLTVRVMNLSLDTNYSVHSACSLHHSLS